MAQVCIRCGEGGCPLISCFDLPFVFFLGQSWSDNIRIRLILEGFQQCANQRSEMIIVDIW